MYNIEAIQSIDLPDIVSITADLRGGSLYRVTKNTQPFDHIVRAAHVVQIGLGFCFPAIEAAHRVLYWVNLAISICKLADLVASLHVVIVRCRPEICLSSLRRYYCVAQPKSATSWHFYLKSDAMH